MTERIYAYTNYHHVVGLGGHSTTRVAAPAHKTENVFLITVDGLRWQEVFAGMEARLATRDFKVWDTNRLRAQFWRETPEERRVRDEFTPEAAAFVTALLSKESKRGPELRHRH